MYRIEDPRLSKKVVELQKSYKLVIPDPDPVSPGHINDWRSRIECGMTTFLDSLGSEALQIYPSSLILETKPGFECTFNSLFGFCQMGPGVGVKIIGWRRKSPLQPLVQVCKCISCY